MATETYVTLPASERWCSVDEISRHLGVAPDTIYRWISGSEMPAHRIGRLWKFKLSEVDVWVREEKTRNSKSSRCFFEPDPSLPNGQL
jgi:excisionase family DNA binding protein